MVIVPIGIATFFLVPLIVANVREVASSALLPGGALVVPSPAQADQAAGLVLGALFTVAAYVLGALGIGAICVATWPSIAGNLDRPTAHSVLVDLRPRVAALVRTALLVGIAVYVLQAIAALVGSAIGHDIRAVTDPADYVRQLSGAQITAQVMLNLVVTGGVLALLTSCFLAVPVVVFEGRGGLDALRRSRELVRGNAWRVFAILATVGAIRQVGWSSVALASIAPERMRAAPTFDAIDEAVRLLAPSIDLVALSLLAIWMGAAYTQLLGGTRVEMVDAPRPARD